MRRPSGRWEEAAGFIRGERRAELAGSHMKLILLIPDCHLSSFFLNLLPKCRPAARHAHKHIHTRPSLSSAPSPPPPGSLLFLGPLTPASQL